MTIWKEQNERDKNKSVVHGDGKELTEKESESIWGGRNVPHLDFGDPLAAHTYQN
jgi:hypothetical protein